VRVRAKERGSLRRLAPHLQGERVAPAECPKAPPAAAEALARAPQRQATEREEETNQHNPAGKKNKKWTN